MTLKEIVKQLESCGYECEAGPLRNNTAFIALKEASNFCNKETDEMFRTAYAIAQVKGRSKHEQSRGNT
jgi:hypothetical protein